MAGAALRHYKEPTDRRARRAVPLRRIAILRFRSGQRRAEFAGGEGVEGAEAGGEFGGG